MVRSQISYAVDTRKHWTAVMFSTTLYTVPVKTSTFFEYFSQKSANFYNVWLTHMVDTFTVSAILFFFLKFQLSCGVTIGYLRCIQFLRETMKIR